MKRNARVAFTRLKKLGAMVIDRSDRGEEFIIIAELRTSDDHYFADYYQRELKEHCDESGKIQNPFGIRTDVNDILQSNGLYAEWTNPAMVGVFQK